MKLLVISYAFPPIPYGGTYRVLRLVRGFSTRGINSHVVTLKEYSDIPNDYDLLKKIPESVVVHRVPIIDPWRKYHQIKDKFIGKLGFKLVNKLVSFGLRFISFPDHMMLWVPFAVLKARKVIQKHGINTVLVSSPPDSSQFIGWILKKWLKVRWIADFRDPIYGNVAQVNLIDPTTFMDKIHKKLLLKYDRLIACNADILVANTDTHAKYLLRTYGCAKVQVVRNSYEPTDFLYVEKEKHPIFTIAHVGSIYGKRNPDLLFAAIQQLALEYAPQKLQLQLVFIGLGGASLRDNIERFQLEDYVKIQKQVPHHEAIETMLRSHLLLLIKATGKWSEGQIPGKIFEYIGSRNPILCLGPKDSEVATLIQEYELGDVVEDDPAEMLSVIRKKYEEYLHSGNLPELTGDQIKPFSSTVMVEKMIHVLEHL